MERHRNWFCTVVDMKSQDRYVCFTRRKGGGGLCVNVTDAAAVWSADCSEDVLKPQDVEPHGDVRVVVQHTRAVLHVGSGSRPAAFSVTLTRMEAPQATEALKELLFTMADTLTQLDSLWELSCESFEEPAAMPSSSFSDLKPRQQQQQNGAATKRRLPGASLINPGTKKKVQATGVAFDDEDEV
ncbi:PREDICTED: protein PAXX isoform X3 [Poecilia mexicana]|uniref:protein PAXX isoform X3 n=1 Tax=Poecilia mexicana TaxID=48701 RepID=UPI00072E2F97|nr:PREDICTED: protein PAXX isoform X3 [Poecilia mexicana]